MLVRSAISRPLAIFASDASLEVHVTVASDGQLTIASGGEVIHLGCGVRSLVADMRPPSGSSIDTKMLWASDASAAAAATDVVTARVSPPSSLGGTPMMQGETFNAVGDVQLLNLVETHRLKPPAFNP
jgi:hypothetical protein